MEHTEHRPLGVHFLFSSKREPIHLFIDRDVDQNRLNTSKPFTVLFASAMQAFLKPSLFNALSNHSSFGVTGTSDSRLM